MYHIFIIQSTDYRYLGCFPFLSIARIAAMDISEQYQGYHIFLITVIILNNRFCKLIVLLSWNRVPLTNSSHSNSKHSLLHMREIVWFLSWAKIREIKICVLHIVTLMLIPCLDSVRGNDAHILTNTHIHTHAACLPRKSHSVPLLANYCLHLCYQRVCVLVTKNSCLKNDKWLRF